MIIELVSKEGDSFVVSEPEAKTSGMLRRFLFDIPVNCRKIDPINQLRNPNQLNCPCYLCAPVLNIDCCDDHDSPIISSSDAIPLRVHLDRIPSALLKKVVEFMSYKVNAEELISTHISSLAPYKLRDLCTKLDKFHFGNDPNEILNLIVVADYLDL